MELRHLALVLLASFASAQEAVRHYPLDPEAIVTIGLAVDAPTTCVFPGPLTGLEGAGIATEPEADALVLLSYQDGAGHFSLRAMQPDIEAGLNVLYAGNVYALHLVTGSVADRTVTFRQTEAPTNRWHALIARAQMETYRSRAPGAAMVAPFRPGTVTAYRGFSAVLEAVYRYEAENALVCHIRLVNPGTKPVNYDPTGLGLQVQRQVWFAEAAEATGAIPPAGTAHAWFAVGADLTAAAPFSVIVPAR